MTFDGIVRELRQEEQGAALALVWRVFLEFEAPDYTKKGVDAFDRSIHETAYLAQLRWYGAFEKETLVGMLATRSEGTHIALFFRGRTAPPAGHRQTAVCAGGKPQSVRQNDRAFIPVRCARVPQTRLSGHGGRAERLRPSLYADGAAARRLKQRKLRLDARCVFCYYESESTRPSGRTVLPSG